VRCRQSANHCCEAKFWHGPIGSAAQNVGRSRRIHVANIVGEDQIGIGTDFTQGYGESFFRYITHDKGHGRKLTDFGEIVIPEGFPRLEDFPNMTDALGKHGWSERRIRKVMGENWFRALRDAWGA
jgi:membrane dipeptidase